MTGEERREEGEREERPMYQNVYLNCRKIGILNSMKGYFCEVLTKDTNESKFL